MIDQEQLEFVRDVLDDTLISGEVKGDRVLQALEIVADALQDGEDNDGDSNPECEVPSTGNGAFDDLETDIEPVQENNDSPSQSAS